MPSQKIMMLSKMNFDLIKPVYLGRAELEAKDGKFLKKGLWQLFCRKH